MAITIKQIAELAGVSRGTVDRALNSRGGVNPEVEKRINKIAKELKYKPNLVAKALSNSKHMVNIAVLINSGGNHFFDKVLIGIRRIQRYINNYGVNVIIHEMTGYNVDAQLEMIENLSKTSIKGLIITPINDTRIIKRLNQLAASGVKITTLNTDVAGINKLCYVGCDYVKSGQTAAELLGLVSSGTTVRVCIVTGSHKILGHVQRIKGFKEVIAKSYPNISVLDVVENIDDDFLSYEVTKKLLNEKSPNALYFCAGGIDGGIKAVIEQNCTNIKIITVDDTENIKEYIKADIINATICQQPIRQGYEAVLSQYNYFVNGKSPCCKQFIVQNEIKLKYNLD
ncbi:MAG: LacI family DNA-binding transcriptional regulator [Oscillospiraceae bacterium]